MISSAFLIFPLPPRLRIAAVEYLSLIHIFYRALCRVLNLTKRHIFFSNDIIQFVSFIIHAFRSCSCLFVCWQDTLVPDGIADVRGTVNETTAQDTSNSEFWSSFSSSEERLLECEGLLLNLPLTPHRKCEAHRPEDQLAAAAGPNTVTYK